MVRTTQETDASGGAPADTTEKAATTKGRVEAVLRSPSSRITKKKTKKSKNAIAAEKTAADGKPRRAHRWRPGTKALREIRQYQKSTKPLLSKAPFRRLVREIAGDYKHDLRWTRGALECLQEAGEKFLVDNFEQAHDLALHSGRVTLMKRDMRLAGRMKDLSM